MLSQKQKNIRKWSRRIILFICFIAIVYVYRRFSIVYIAHSYLPLGIFSKSYVLVDKQFYYGRKLTTKDKVIYLSSQDKRYIGYIVAIGGAHISHKKNTLYINGKKSLFPKFSLLNFNLPPKKYLVYGPSYEIISAERIKARLLMVLMNESF